MTNKFLDALGERICDVLEWYLERDQKKRNKSPYKLGD